MTVRILYIYTVHILYTFLEKKILRFLSFSISTFFSPTWILSLLLCIFLINSPVTENPPSDCYQPHDDQGHGEDVVEKVTAELTDVTTSTAPTEPPRQLVESDPEEEEDPDAQTSRH